MYEFCFTITHEEGANRFADALSRDDSLHARAVYACLSRDRMWRLETVTGDPAALDEVEPLLVDPEVDREGVTARGCTADRTHSLLTSEPGRRTVYSHFADARRCDAVPLLAVKYAPGGMLVEARRRARTTRWRILLQTDRKAGLIYDTLSARLADGATFEFDRLVEADGWHDELLTPQALASEQRETLELAFERGYFETPRETTLDELADELDAPRSTVSYRLRRAVAELVQSFVTR